MRAVELCSGVVWRGVAWRGVAWRVLWLAGSLEFACLLLFLNESLLLGDKEL